MTWKDKNNIIYRLSLNGSRLKRISDAFVFARDGRVLEGTLPISAFERLDDLLLSNEGDVSYRLEGFKGEQGELTLQLTVGGVLLLSCQRCLEAVPCSLDVDSLLQLIPEGAELSQEELEDDTRDFLPVIKGLDVAELVEDEILLALPVIARHEKCGLPGAADAGGRVNPFAALAELKGKPN